MEIHFQEMYYLMLGKEYLVKSADDEKALLDKQKKIFDSTGIKPKITISFRNKFQENV